MATLNFKTPVDAKENRRLKDKFAKHLSQQIKEARRNKKMTQQELADKAGLHLTYVGHLELGKYHPTVFVMWKIAKVLGVSIDKLIEI
ncbi:helix-turn-helix transcriptional regulator [Candidatus Microgenomates bacterium]|nr:helix-turn-helix transcriptional regulator [Candidatus Microgenomates bacterium]